MRLSSKLQELSEKGAYQKVYVFFLVSIVVFVIIMNTILLIGDFRKTVNVELQRKALLSAELIDNVRPIQIEDRESLQNYVWDLANIAEEFLAVDVLVPKGKSFEVIASLEERAIGHEANQVQFDLAWREEQPIAHVTNAPTKTSVELPSLFYTVDRNQYWVVTKPFYIDREPAGLLSLKLSANVVQDLISRTLIKSYLLLTLTVLLTLAVIAFLFVIFRSSARDRRKVQELDDVKSNFITVVSHVLRTPLNSVRWNLELLLSGDLGKISKEQEEFIRLIYKANQNSLQSVQSLLLALDIQQQTLRVQKEKISVKDLVDSVLLSLNPEIVTKELKVSWNKPTRLSKITADPKLIEQVIYAIIDNAVKYTKEKGNISVDLKTIDKKHILISVKDTGVGIPEDEKEKIFTKFYRGRQALKMFTDAAGLSLFIGKYIVDKHDGEIWFESKEGEGTTFFVKLPING